MNIIVDRYAALFRSALIEHRRPEIDRKVSQYRCRLEAMYASDTYRKHNIYPTINVERVYAVIAMCLELKTYERMYMEMFKYDGIRSLCKIFCMTDELAYSLLPKHVQFIRHSDLSDGDSCHDEIININEHFRKAERRG